MKDITIQCDRCGKLINGGIDEVPEYGGKVTAGFYIVSEGNWKEFGRWEEDYVCDDCMHADKKYQKLYALKE